VALAFGNVILDTEGRQLTRDGDPVHLKPKAFQLLVFLVTNRPKALSKSEIQEALWPETFVVESNLRALVNEVRVAIGDTEDKPRLVRTLHGFGYSFAGRVWEVSPQSRPWMRFVHELTWEGGRVELDEGENVIGRARKAGVWISDESVSRRHARIVVSAGGATLEDLGSKNGTSRGEEPVIGAVSLRDGDTLRVGSVAFTYHVDSDEGSTKTGTALSPATSLPSGPRTPGSPTLTTVRTKRR
jgi:DNA-binding winged helix-turn-helix (wHTH) protein